MVDYTKHYRNKYGAVVATLITSLYVMQVIIRNMLHDVFKKLFVAAFLLGAIYIIYFTSFLDARVKSSVSSAVVYVPISSYDVADIAKLLPANDPAVIRETDQQEALIPLRQKHTQRNSKCEQRTSVRKKPTCSFARIQHYMDECNYFPTKLTSYTSDKPLFDFCTMPQSPASIILDYFHDNIDRFLLIGDSNGIRYATAVMTHFASLGIKCKNTKSGAIGFITERKYFYQSGPEFDALLDMDRTCKYCVNVHRYCDIPPTTSHQKKKTITFEFLPVIFNLLERNAINRSYCNQNPHLPICQFDTAGDFIFRYYLNNTYPDLLVISPSFAHDVRQPLHLTIPRLPLFKDLLAEVLPQHAHVVWFPCLTLNLNLHPSNKTDDSAILASFRNDTTELMNHLLFEVLQKPVRDAAPSVHGFFEVGEIGRAKERQWADDIVHFRPPYYNAVIQMLFQLLPSLEDDNDTIPRWKTVDPVMH